MFSYHLDWSDSTSSGPFYVYKDSDQIGVTTEKEMIVNIEPNTYPVVQVFDSSSDLPDYYPAGHIDLIWSNPANVPVWTIEQYVDSEWTTVGEVFSDGLPQVKWVTPYLSDSSSYTYRAVPKNSNQIEGDALVFEIVTARIPDIPSFALTATYDSTGVLEKWEVVSV